MNVITQDYTTKKAFNEGYLAEINITLAMD